MEYEQQLQEWFDKYSEQDLTFESLPHKYNECLQVSAIVFLASKLKDKAERYFLHGEHDCLYIGESFDVFESFTEQDVKIAVHHGLYIEEDGGFGIYASM